MTGVPDADTPLTPGEVLARPSDPDIPAPGAGDPDTTPRPAGHRPRAARLKASDGHVLSAPDRQDGVAVGTIAVEIMFLKGVFNGLVNL